MKQLKMLILTDHRNHSSENSLYTLAKAMRRHPRCAQIDIATRGNELNNFFFEKKISKGLFVSKVQEQFAFNLHGRHFKKDLHRAYLRDYDVVWLRMPPPLSKDFLDFLQQEYATALIINDPEGIYLTGSKAFLLNFLDLCPPMMRCQSIDDILAFKNRFPIVLKPLQGYGGKGIVRVDGDRVWNEMKQMSFDQFLQQIEQEKIDYLGVKYLENASQGDKRIVVVNGQIMGASLRVPAEGSWLCNVGQGGRSVLSEVNEEEIQIVEQLNPILAKAGIVMYGVDTLTGDEGKRVLSEINTTSIGGLPQIANMSGQPLVKTAINLFWKYIIEKTYGESSICRE